MSSSSGGSNTSPEGGTASSGGSSGGTASSGGSSGGTASSGGSSGGTTGDGASCTVQQVPLTVSSTGYVDVTAINIVGAWFAYGDGLGSNGAPPGNCETTGMFPTSSCSSITFPPGPPGDGGPASFPQTTPGTMCISGTAAQVIGTPPDYSDIFGIGIGLDFNNPSGTPSTYDANMNHVTAFTFTVSGLPTTGAVRVEFDEPATEPAPSDAWSYTLTANGSVTVELQSGLGTGQLSPSFTTTYPAGESQPPFDPTMLKAIQFHVVTNTMASIPVDNFCISALTATVCL